MCNKQVILIVDSDPILSSELSSAISKLKYRVNAANSLKQAESLLIADSPSLIIVEDKEGFLTAIKSYLIKHNIEAKIAIATESNEKLDTIFPILQKPVLEEGLQELLNKIFNHKGATEIKSVTTNSIVEREIVSKDATFLSLLAIANKVAKAPSAVMIRGESGTGKELVARYIHSQSDRANGPFVALNCASLPETLLESELFGHERGAFTGAISKKIGKFELANKGTLLLDEVTEMSVDLQAKLLRAIQEKEIDRIGSKEPVKIDIRLISTTNRDIGAAIESGDFREDLFFRLNVIELILPPLRDRQVDIPILVKHFIKKYSKVLNKEIKNISKEAATELQTNKWRGNIRELENIIERAMLLAEENEITLKDLMIRPTISSSAKDQDIIEAGTTIAGIEKKLIIKTLEHVDYNKSNAAKMLGVSIRTLRNRLTEYKLSNDGEKSDHSVQ
ncbi:MAG: sigma 54-interacting transcriptional regulator [Nitrospinota bacterium]